MRFYRRNEKKFTSDNMNSMVSISVDSGYWFNKIDRTLQDLADLYNALFPSIKSVDGVVSPEADLKAQAVTDITARGIWRSIRENPESPPGPLTLAAICLAMLLGANFADPRDRRAFFIFMEHNNDFQNFFLWGMRDEVNRPNQPGVVEQLLKQFPAVIQTSEEASRLAQIWGQLHTKIVDATRGEGSSFFTELFKIAPTVAHRFSAEQNAPDSLKRLAFKGPGVVAAAALGYEKSPGYLSGALQLPDIIDLLNQTIRWVKVPISGEWVSAECTMIRLYPDHPLDTAAFIAQLDPTKLDLTLAGPFSDKFRDASGHFLVPKIEYVNTLFETIGSLLNNAIGYLFRHRPADINTLFGVLANTRFSSEAPNDRQRFLELRYRLYHPITIKAMAEFWLQNFESFKIAAGEHDEFLAHLIRHMPDPVNFMRRMLQKKSANPQKNDQDQRWDYFAPRFAKILPVIENAAGPGAAKKLRALLGRKIKRRGVEYVGNRLEDQVQQLVDHYARHFQDPDEQLLTLLDEPIIRSASFGTAEQIAQCLSSQTPGDLKTVNSRFEVIIAGDDRLFAKVLPPAPHQVQRFKAYYPTLWARFKLSEVMENEGLRSYVETSGLPTCHLEVGKQPRMLSIREAFVIASNESYWREIDPYTQHPVRAFFEWLIPGSQKNFFDSKQKNLQSKSVILAMRMEWQRDQSTRFELFLAAKLNVFLASKKQEIDGYVVSDNQRREFADLVADLGRGPELFELYKGGNAVLPQNRCRTSAFLAQVNTPQKVRLAYDFILSIDKSNIDAEAVFQLMIRDESPTEEEKRSGKTCFELAKRLIYNNNALLPEVIALHMKHAQQLSRDVMGRLVSLIVDKNLPISYQGNAGIECDEFIRALVKGKEARKAMTAADLLRIRNVSPTVFNELMQSEAGLRQKLVANLQTMSAQELQEVGVMGLGVVFREAPECLYAILLKLPSNHVPEGLSGPDKDDIFMLNPPTRWEAADLSNLPLFKYMMDQDLGEKKNVDLVMRCLNSKNQPLANLMRQVLTYALKKGSPVYTPTLLLRFLMHESANREIIESIFAEGAVLRDEIRSILLSPKFVEQLLCHNKTMQFSESSTKLWTVLLNSPAIRAFIDKGLPFNDPNKQTRSAANQWSMQSDLFKKRVLAKAKDSGARISVENTAGQRFSFDASAASAQTASVAELDFNM